MLDSFCGALPHVSKPEKDPRLHFGLIVVTTFSSANMTTFQARSDCLTYRNRKKTLVYTSGCLFELGTGRIHSLEIIGRRASAELFPIQVFKRIDLRSNRVF